MQNTIAHPLSDEMRQCIQNCTDCHSVCLQTVSYCLDKGGKYGEAIHIRLLLNCADICQTSANFMQRGSDLHGLTCAVCATVCEKCAQACEQFGDDTQMKVCADICHRCADSCRPMANALANRVASMAT